MVHGVLEVGKEVYDLAYGGRSHTHAAEGDHFVAPTDRAFLSAGPLLLAIQYPGTLGIKLDSLTHLSLKIRRLSWAFRMIFEISIGHSPSFPIPVKRLMWSSGSPGLHPSQFFPFVTTSVGFVLLVIACVGLSRGSGVTYVFGCCLNTGRPMPVVVGVCNGTRMIVKQLLPKVIEAQVITGTRVSQKVFLPRIPLILKDPIMPFIFKRKQFPVNACYAMMINKIQGQSLNKIGIFLPELAFGHAHSVPQHTSNPFSRPLLQVYWSSNREPMLRLKYSQEGEPMVTGDATSRKRTGRKTINIQNLDGNTIGFTLRNEMATQLMEKPVVIAVSSLGLTLVNGIAALGNTSYSLLPQPKHPGSIGLMAIGGMAIGAMDIGGMAIGLMAIGAVDIGGMAIGAMDIGGMAIGAMAIGGRPD
nr:DNA helicase [Tanacetum cinerariifolium]